jgi:hypothetical protein
MPLRLLLCVLFLPFAGCQLWPVSVYPRLQFPPGSPQTRVLMIGDSLTYYHDLPGLLQQLSVAENAPINIQQITTAYTSLAYHWSHGAADTIRNGHFDFVVLQEFSRKPVTDPEDSINDFAKFDGEIKKAGGRTIIFQNWTRAGHEKDDPDLLQTYSAVISQTGAALAPIGAAWKLCAAERPDIPLLADDRHPTQAGTYLAACVLYDAIYHKKSGNLPTSLQAPVLPLETLATLRSFADRAIASPP